MKTQTPNPLRRKSMQKVEDFDFHLDTKAIEEMKQLCKCVSVCLDLVSFIRLNKATKVTQRVSVSQSHSHHHPAHILRTREKAPPPLPPEDWGVSERVLIESMCLKYISRI